VRSTNPARYTPTAITLHWLIALIIFCSFPLGLYMVELPLSPARLRLYSWHKWAGVTVFALAVLRIAWRATHPAPPPLPMPRWQLMASSATHHMLYVLIVVVPLSGWLYSSAAGFQTVYFGVLPIPDLIGKDKALADQLKLVHLVLNYALAALIAAHLAASLKHHLVDRDGLLGRMIPFLDKA
jgi:cytochrome b561